MRKITISKVARIVLLIALPLVAFVITMAIVMLVQKQTPEDSSTEPMIESSTNEDQSAKPMNESSDSSSETPEESSTPAETSKEESSEQSSEEAEESSEESSEDDSSDTETSDENGEEDSEEESWENSEASEEDPSSEESDVNYSYQTPYLIRVNMSTNVITIFTYDENGEYTVPVKAMICSTGPNSPLGTYTMGYQARWNGLILDEWGQYVSHITGDFLFHTVPSATQSASTVIVSDYNQLGTTCSHGCIRITAGDAYWMYVNCTAYETLIEIDYFDSDPLGKPQAIQLPTDTEYNWDPTDPDPENPWNNVTPHFEGVTAARTLEYGAAVPDLTEGVTAYDTCGNVLGYYSVDNPIDTLVPGGYTVTYSCYDALGRSAEATTLVTVLPAPEESSEGSETDTENESSTEDSAADSGETSE